jgi:hypothetical protein
MSWFSSRWQVRPRRAPRPSARRRSVNLRLVALPHARRFGSLVLAEHAARGYAALARCRPQAGNNLVYLLETNFRSNGYYQRSTKLATEKDMPSLINRRLVRHALFLRDMRLPFLAALADLCQVFHVPSSGLKRKRFRGQGWGAGLPGTWPAFVQIWSLRLLNLELSTLPRILSSRGKLEISDIDSLSINKCYA